MDSDGNMYASKEFAEMVEREFGKVPDPMRAIDEAPDDAIEIVDGEVAAQLATMNRHSRRVYFSERRRGRSEQAALEAAREALPR